MFWPICLKKKNSTALLFFFFSSHSSFEARGFFIRPRLFPLVARSLAAYFPRSSRAPLVAHHELLSTAEVEEGEPWKRREWPRPPPRTRLRRRPFVVVAVIFSLPLPLPLPLAPAPPSARLGPAAAAGRPFRGRGDRSRHARRRQRRRERRRRKRRRLCLFDKQLDEEDAVGSGETSQARPRLVLPFRRQYLRRQLPALQVREAGGSGPSSPWDFNQKKKALLAVWKD